MCNVVSLKEVSNMLKVHNDEAITVCLATKTIVSVSKVSLDLSVKFLDFNCKNRCLILDLDTRYDLILGMAWLERHEPCID